MIRHTLQQSKTSNKRKIIIPFIEISKPGPRKRSHQQLSNISYPCGAVASYLKEEEAVAVEARSTNTDKKKKNSSNKKHQILAEADRYTGTKKKRYTSYFPSNSHHPSTQNQSKTHKLSTPARLQPNQALHSTIQTDLQSPKSRIQQLLYYLYDKTPPLTSLYQYMQHSKQKHALFTPLRRSCQERKKKHARSFYPDANGGVRVEADHAGQSSTADGANAERNGEQRRSQDGYGKAWRVRLR